MATRSKINREDAATWWADDSGVVHICESAAPIGTELLVWTLCDREVEAGAAFSPTRYHEVTCSKCTAAEAILRRRSRGTRHEAALT